MRIHNLVRLLPVLLIAIGAPGQAHAGSPALAFSARSEREARAWQEQARTRLFELMMGGARPDRCALAPKTLRRIEAAEDQLVLEEIQFQSLPDRTGHAWIARPKASRGKLSAVLAIPGHGGSAEDVVRGRSLYWYGREMARMGYVVVAPDVSQHTLQHTNWTLMGERTWDAIRCVDYLEQLPEIDTKRLAVAGLSLGGETTMYVAALDPRLALACSSGWLTTVENMKNGHCPCWNFAGLEENFDFSDIFACIAPRPLFCELGEQERAPGGFPVSIGRAAFEKVRQAYSVFAVGETPVLTVFPGPHVFCGKDFFPKLRDVLGRPEMPMPGETAPGCWMRFVNAAESLDGTPYHWLGTAPLKLVFERRPTPGDVLELSWGAKGDEREALLSVNGRTMPTVQAGGHWGFRWIRVPLPTGISGGAYELEFKPAGQRPAFFSEVRLVSPGRRGSVDLRKPAQDAKLVAYQPGSESVRLAFPEMASLWTTPVPAPKGLSKDDREQFARAEASGRLANEAFYRCRKFVDGWLAHADPDSGLIPRNFRESRDFWNGRDSAADNYPFMVLTAAMTDPGLLNGRMLEILRTETKLTSRVGALPDDYSFSKHGWRREQVQLQEIIFDGAEYVKDGLLPITEWLGPSPWSERMLGITDEIWRQAAIETPYGALATLNFEVNGDLLQACSRLYWFTGQSKYLDWAVRLGDYYLLGTNHPTRDLRQLRLIDHGCEVVNGLTELYVAVSHARPEKQRAYQKPLREMFRGILEQGRNEHGLLYSWFNPQTGEHSKDLCDTWGYDLDGVYTMWLQDRDKSGREAVLKALGNLAGNYVGACWADKSADGFADSIEGAINLLNREFVGSAAGWTDSQTRLMWDIQKPDGVIEGWHGDGNFARTSLMYALWKTQGLTVRPWRKDVRFGAVRNGRGLKLSLATSEPWAGRLVFDRPRHTEYMKLPLDYTRINQFPEWFTADAKKKYRVTTFGDSKTSKVHRGVELLEGLPVELRGGEVVWLEAE